MADFDAIVVGSGHHGMACALCLAAAGWRVLVLERAAQVGGALRSAEVTLPGFTHDLCATNVGRFRATPLYREFQGDFESAGLRFRTNAFPYASVFPSGRAIGVSTDPEKTEGELGSHSRADLEGWRKALALYKRTAADLTGLSLSRLPSPEMWQQLRRIAQSPADALQLCRLVWETPRRLVDRFFHSEPVKGLVAPWAFHADHGPDVHGGGLFSFVAAMSSHVNGLHIVEGGSSRIAQALRLLILARGGTVLTNQEVVRVQVRNGCAAAVETRGGENYTASRSVIANVTPAKLFGALVAGGMIEAGELV